MHSCCVPHFYFDLYNDVVALDPAGVELAGIEEQKHHALVEACEMVGAIAAECRIELNHFIEIRDECGKILGRAHFDEAVSIFHVGKMVKGSKI